MAIASLGNFNMLGNISTQNSMLQMMDMSALTKGTVSATDSATLSQMFGSDYTSYQNMLSSVSTTALSGAGSTSTSVAGVGLTADGMFDFKSYFNTYFPNLSDEEVASLTEMYTKNYEAMYEQIGGAMDMSNLASMVTGDGGSFSFDTDSILKQVSAAGSQTSSTSFDVSDYLKTYFPDLNNRQIANIANKYTEQYNSLT